MVSSMRGFAKLYNYSHSCLSLPLLFFFTFILRNQEFRLIVSKIFLFTVYIRVFVFRILAKNLLIKGKFVRIFTSSLVHILQALGFASNNYYRPYHTIPYGLFYNISHIPQQLYPSTFE